MPLNLAGSLFSDFFRIEPLLALLELAAHSYISDEETEAQRGGGGSVTQQISGRAGTRTQDSWLVLGAQTLCPRAMKAWSPNCKVLDIYEGFLF